MPTLRAFAPLLASFALLLCCGGDDNTSTGTITQTGRACTSASQCYAGLGEASALRGEVQCLDRVTGGYCTHLCTTDADCCALTGECPDGRTQVCAPFESTGQMMCFLSCEASAIADQQATYADGTGYCQHFANAAFGCRSTGGGSKNRKVCLP